MKRRMIPLFMFVLGLETSAADSRKPSKVSNVAREPSRTGPANATLHAALVRLHQEDPSATRRLQSLQACSYESNVQYLEEAEMFGAQPRFGASAIPKGKTFYGLNTGDPSDVPDDGYQFWTPTIEEGETDTDFTKSTAQSRVIPFTHADCCLRCQLLFGCKGFTLFPNNLDWGGVCYFKTEVGLTQLTSPDCEGAGQPVPVSGRVGVETNTPLPQFQNRVELDTVQANPYYDYIVVGGGAAGTAAAYTLADLNRNKKVLLIEKGARLDPDAKDNNKCTDGGEWRLDSPHVESAFGICEALGGCTTWNGRQWRRVPRWYVKDLMGLPSDLVDAFDEASCWADDMLAAPENHPRQFPRATTEFEAFANNLGLKTATMDYVEFYNAVGKGGLSYKAEDDANQLGDAPGFIGYSMFATHDNELRTSGQKLVESYAHGNLDILVEARVSKIVFEMEYHCNHNCSATGVEMFAQRRLEGGVKTEDTGASERVMLLPGGEIILAANVYETPSALIYSGYGPKDVTDELGIPQLFNQNDTAIPEENKEAMEQVGKNYYNQFYLNRVLAPFFEFKCEYGQHYVVNTKDPTEGFLKDTVTTFIRYEFEENTGQPEARVRVNSHVSEEAIVQYGVTVPAGAVQLSSDIECSSRQVTGHVRPRNGSPFNTEITAAIDVNATEFAKTMIDCVQAYFWNMWWPFHRGNYSGHSDSEDASGESASGELLPPTKWNFSEVAKQFLRSDEWATGEQAAIDRGPANTTNSVLQKVLDQGQDVAVADRIVWSEDTSLLEAIREWRLFYLGPNASTISSGYAEADSVHYGGSASLGNVVDPATFKPFGLDNVRVADLSAFKEPTPGNTMAAAYTIGHFVAKFLVSDAALPEPFEPELEHARLVAKRETFAWQRYKTELASEGFELLHLPDGSNFHRPIVDDQTFASTTSGTPDPKLPCVWAAGVQRCTTPRSLDAAFEEALTPKEAVYAKPDEFALCSTTRSTLAIARTDLVDYELRFSAKIPSDAATPAVIVMGQVEPNYASALGPRLDGVTMPVGVEAGSLVLIGGEWNDFTLRVDSSKGTVGWSVNGVNQHMVKIAAPALGRRLGFVFDGDGEEMCYRDIMLKVETTSDTFTSPKPPPPPSLPPPPLPPPPPPLISQQSTDLNAGQQRDWLLALSGAAVIISCLSPIIVPLLFVKHYQKKYALVKVDAAPTEGQKAEQISNPRQTTQAC